MITTQASFGANWLKWDDLISKYAKGIPFNVVKTIMMVESSLGLNPSVAKGILNPNDVQGSASQDGKSWGLLQMRPSTAQDYDKSATAEKLNVPEYAIDLGCRHLAHLCKLFSGHEEWIAKAWNQGATATARERDAVAPGHALAYWEKYQGYRAILL